MLRDGALVRSRRRRLHAMLYVCALLKKQGGTMRQPTQTGHDPSIVSIFTLCTKGSWGGGRKSSSGGERKEGE